jgi:hypothetical protein
VDIATTYQWEDRQMPIKSTAADGTRYHAVVGALGRVILGGTGKTTRTAHSLGQDSAAPAVALRSEPLGATGGLTRILMALMRQAYAAPRDRARARANADLLLETIRLSSVL